MALPVASEQATKGDRTRRRLLRLAIERFAAEGYRHTTVSEVARAAELTPAAVYAYFANKEALFAAAVDADAEALIAAAEREIGEGDVRIRWLGLLATLGELLPEYPLAARVLAGREPGMLARLLDLPSLDAVAHDLAADLTDAQRRGEVRTDIDPPRAANGMATIVLALLLAQTQLGADPGEDRRADVLEILDAALRPPAPLRSTST
jgi:AcrR family transcriptional regulator